VGPVRWLLEQYEFPFEVIYAQALDAGNLRASLDVLLLPDGAVREPTPTGGQTNAETIFNQEPKPEDIPAEFRERLGRITPEKTLPQLKKFADEGGTIVAFGGSAVLGWMLGLPVEDHLTEIVDGQERRLANAKFYVPGSVLRVAVDNSNPLAYGMDKQVDIFFDESPVMRLLPNAALNRVRAVAWFDSNQPLRSGWAWGQSYLQGGAAVVESPLGKGKVLLFGPEITFRGQPHGTFKFLFNAIYYSRAVASGTGAATPTSQ
jgi:hypothetical protein